MHAAGSLKILCGLFSFQVTVYIQNVTFRAHEVNHERSVRNHISIWEFTDLGDYLFGLIGIPGRGGMPRCLEVLQMELV